MVACLNVGLQKAGHNAVNFDKLQEIAPRLVKKLAQFLARLTEVLQKYTKLDPSLTEGTIVLNTHFISLSSPNIQKKLKKAGKGPQTHQWGLLNLAFKNFYNWEEQAKLEKAQGDQSKYHLLVNALYGSKPPSSNEQEAATLAPLQMWQRRPLGLLILKAKAGPMSPLWHKKTGQLPKPPLGI